MKNKGLTLLELMIAVAILAILLSMLNPLLVSITRSSKKSQEMSSLDLNIGRSLTLFSRAVRSSKNMSTKFGTTRSGIYIAHSKRNNSNNSNFGDAYNNSIGNAIVINVPKKNETTKIFEDEKVIFYIDNNKLMINSTTNKNGNFKDVTSPTILVRNVVEDKSYFRYEENIAIINLTVYSNTEKTEKKTVREASVTRINLDF